MFPYRLPVAAETMPLDCGLSFDFTRSDAPKFAKYAAQLVVLIADKLGSVMHPAAIQQQLLGSLHLPLQHIAGKRLVHLLLE